MYALLAVIGLLGLATGLLLFVWGLIKQKKNKGGLIVVLSSALIIVTFILTPTTETQEAAPVEETEKVEEVEKEVSGVVETQAGAETLDDWNAFIDELVANGESEQEKFKALELYANDYVTNAAEFKDFSQTIVVDYMSGTYLNNHTDHKTMLTKIFKSFVVEKAASGPVKDFAFDYYQNVKYVYRGVDAIDSAAVKSNERQMDDAIERINQ